VTGGAEGVGGQLPANGASNRTTTGQPQRQRFSRSGHGPDAADSDSDFQ
jgi:hypothetical protein